MDIIPGTNMPAVSVETSVKTPSPIIIQGAVPGEYSGDWLTLVSPSRLPLQIPGRFWWPVLGSTYEATHLCESSHPVPLSIYPRASVLRPVFEPWHLLQFVQLRRDSSTARTLPCPGKTRDHDPGSIYKTNNIYCEKNPQRTAVGSHSGALFIELRQVRKYVDRRGKRTHKKKEEVVVTITDPEKTTQQHYE